MRSLIARFLTPKRQPKRASAHPGPSERARLHALMIDRTRQIRLELGMPWRI